MSQALASTTDRRAIAKPGRLLAAGILVVNNRVLLGVVTSPKSDAEILGQAKRLSSWLQGQVPHRSFRISWPCSVFSRVLLRKDH
jgi:hypothetical protein